jgi:hypothetical protein
MEHLEGMKPVQGGCENEFRVTLEDACVCSTSRGTGQGPAEEM